MKPVITEESQVGAVLQPVILGAHWLAHAYIRAFWETYGVKSIELSLADYRYLSSSSFVDYRVVPGLNQPERLLGILAQLGQELNDQGKAPLLLGCGDGYTRVVSQYKQTLSQWFYVTEVDFALFDELTQKQRFYEICEEIGVPYPRTAYLDCANPHTQFDDHGFTYPLIMKPSSSYDFAYLQVKDKQKVYFVDNAEQAAQILKNYQDSTYDKSLLVQEMIPGPDSQERIVSIFVDKDSRPVFQLCGQVILQDPSPQLVGNPAAIIPDGNPTVLADAVKFLQHVGYHGLLNFDVKYDERDGKYKFFEINTRPGGSTLFVYLAGVNFAQVLVQDYVLGIAAPPQRPTRPFLYSTVSRQILRRYVSPESVRQKTLDLLEQGAYHFALDWSQESIKQRFWARRFLHQQKQKFAKYFRTPAQSRD